MFDLCRHPRLLQGLKAVYRLRWSRARRSRATAAALRIRSEFYRGVWLKAAEKLGASTRFLEDDVMEIERGDFRARVRQNETPLDDYVTVRVAGNKPLTYRLLSEAGLPIPEHARFTLANMRPAIEFLDERRRECVVKPAHDTGGGVGVITGVRSHHRLAHAAAAASVVYGSELLIEEQVPGDNYRLLYLDGRLVDAVVRGAPSVVGDGRSTVRELLARSNEARLARGSAACQSLVRADLEMRHTLAGQGLKLNSRPAAGTVVKLKSVVNDNCGSENATATDALCDSIIDDGARAAAALGVRLAGIDVITADPSVPLRESQGVILEVNTSPGHHWHYHKRDGTFHVAALVLETLLNEHSRHLGYFDAVLES
jgi:cyanophycin synthetase